MIKLLNKFLKAGYLEDFQYANTYSGTPQGGIISPLLANIYLHELDLFVENLKVSFDKPAERRLTLEYTQISSQIARTKRKLKKIEPGEGNEYRDSLLKELRQLKKTLRQTPAKSQTDKKITYIRYADDFLIGVNGSREECEWIKQQLSDFITQTLNMELSKEKTLITHSSEYARFLGYDIRVRREGTVKPNGRGATQRTLSNRIELTVPLKEKIQGFLFQNRIIRQENGKLEPIARTNLLRLTDLEIVSSYNAELRGICNYYNLAANFYKLNYFSYLMEYSCLKTLAAKHKCTIRRIKEKFRDKKGGWCIPYETKQGIKQLYPVKHADCKDTKNPSDQIAKTALIHQHTRSKFEDRLKARVCELCGTTDGSSYEIHHVNKIKNLKGKEPWEVIMIAKRRKTMVLCHDCHKEIHK